MRSNNQNWSFFSWKDFSDDLGGDEAKADPDNESGNKVVTILKSSAESRSWFIFIHSKKTNAGRTPNDEERGNKEDEP